MIRAFPKFGYNPVTGEWNDTLVGQFLWSNVNVSEAVPDVGAPLSHAAIVAREMGIPAVVGCGNATMLLKTGDRIRVDGGHGTVEILGRARMDE